MQKYLVCIPYVKFESLGPILLLSLLTDNIAFDPNRLRTRANPIKHGFMSKRIILPQIFVVALIKLRS